uniref:Uncharacterized protein n=1 Tax=Candidatus Kentrum sp. TUN TaxID=2126343 RepID=A0A450ZYS0_9GAMM|nr:MAG: hypothetical protein BECKTUN1418F_GA0071002_11592 [Candidatus Kentron sp. TUN]VFK67547.1 MAG: hypothetical protein BECKTUN1418E_GA0071001_11542 [Candidatus Kentron sp. TUN]
MYRKNENFGESVRVLGSNPLSALARSANMFWDTERNRIPIMKITVLPVLAYLVDSAALFLCPKGATYISPGLLRSSYPGKGRHKDPTPTGLRKGGLGKQ